MKHRKTLYGNNSRVSDTTVSAMMEQTNLFSLTYKKKISEMQKTVPLYLKNIESYDFFYESSLASFFITRDEYLTICKDIRDMYLKIYSTNLKSKKLWILKRFGQLGFLCVLTGILFFTGLCFTTNNYYRKFVSGFLSTTLAIYFIIVTIFCLFYMLKVFRIRKNSADNIKLLNTYIFRLNIKYRDNNTQFRFLSSSKELIIRKIL